MTELPLPLATEKIPAKTADIGHLLLFFALVYARKDFPSPC